MINLVNESQFPFEPVNVASHLSAIYRLFKPARVKQMIALSAHKPPVLFFSIWFFIYN